MTSSSLFFMAGVAENELHIAINFKRPSGRSGLFDPDGYKPVDEKLELEKNQQFLKNTLDIFEILALSAHNLSPRSREDFDRSSIG